MDQPHASATAPPGTATTQCDVADTPGTTGSPHTHAADSSSRPRSQPRYDPPTLPWASPVVLEGGRVRLEPLTLGHLAGLADVAFEPSIWIWTLARPTDEVGLLNWMTTALRNAKAGAELPFATIDRASGRVIGSTRFLSIVPEHRRLEIGWTWVGRDFQRTGANREA